MSKLNKSLTDETVLNYFDPTTETEVIVDASPVGLAAIMTQKEPNIEGPGRVIAYASRALTDVERRYCQTEREPLAIVWSCEQFHLYFYGNPFKMVSVHKPLEVTWNNPRSKPPARIERWGLRLQPYQFKVIHRPGKDNPADYMSRHPDRASPAVASRQAKVTEEYINFLSDHATPKALTLARNQNCSCFRFCSATCDHSHQNRRVESNHSPSQRRRSGDTGIPEEDKQRALHQL